MPIDGELVINIWENIGSVADLKRDLKIGAISASVDCSEWMAPVGEERAC